MNPFGFEKEFIMGMGIDLFVYDMIQKSGKNHSEVSKLFEEWSDKGEDWTCEETRKRFLETLRNS